MRVRTAAILATLAGFLLGSAAWAQGGSNVINVPVVPLGIPPGGPVTIVQTLQLPVVVGTNIIVSGSVVPRHSQGHAHGHRGPAPEAGQGGSPARGRGEHAGGDRREPGSWPAGAAHHGPLVAVLVGPHGYSNVIVSGGTGGGWGRHDGRGEHRRDRSGAPRRADGQAVLPAPVLNGDGGGRDDGGAGSVDGGSGGY